MDKKNLTMGIGMGALAMGLGAMLLRPRKNRKVKSAVGKALRTMSEVADSVSDAMGW
jgi:gas vesicle protein